MDEFTKHEALDRTSCIMVMVETMLVEHEFISTDETLKKMTDEVHQKLFELYQELGKKTLKDE